MQDNELRRSKRRLGRRLLWLYLILLVASYGTRWIRGAPTPPPGRSTIEVQELSIRDGEPTPTDKTLRLGYLEWPAQTPHGPGAAGGEMGTAPTVLLVHGSPGDGGNFSRLGPALAATGLRVLAPDLPGFGASTLDIEDYSIRAHARYCAELIAALGLEQVHAVGFSMGGGVVLHLAADESPPRVASVTLLSAIGVQELELLGQYHLNHAVHAAQLAGLWLLESAVPHFGALDGTMLNVPYARNFFDTDQRPLRDLLRRFEDPLLVIHGDHDMLVPYQAALEHHRLVPQSELVTFDANHFMVFRDPGGLAAPLADFIHRVEDGAALRRVDAEPQRVADAAAEQVYRLPRAVGPTLLVWMLLLAVATLVSEDLTCVAAGLLVANGSIGFVAASLACGLGIFFGDLGLYALGRLGRPWLGRRPISWFVSPTELARSQRWFEQRGAMVIFLSRFLPGTRLPTYVSAGLLGAHPLWFATCLFVPVALWTPLLVGLSQVVGERLFAMFATFESYALPVFVGVLVALWLILGLGKSLLTHRGRRLLVGRWRAWRHWEFWPLWRFYPPVIVYLIGLAVRYRSVTVWSAANPGMPAGGGFVGESKSEILDRLDPTYVAQYQLLPQGGEGEGQSSRRDAVLRFVETTGGGFPVVLKPDVGQRGAGVVIARDEGQVEAFLRDCTGPAIVQRYVPGPELGIFWVRLPGDDRGRIFAITDKRLPEVVGDGRSTLEHLILEDPRAVAMAKTYFELLDDRLDDVPAAGEAVALAQLGTHCRGAVFLDGEGHRTPELEAAVEAIARSFDGFYFGRFDLKATSLDAFQRGEGLKVLELNGVTSEATSIYDPANGLLDAYRVLFEQWRLAFEIGHRNRLAGARGASLPELAQLALRHLRGANPSGIDAPVDS
ncbi:MAG: alpha/beta fold hydrolase [Acidobacteriota bacterium]